MGFLNKIKTSIGLKAEEHKNQATDNTNSYLQDSQIIKNLDKIDIQPTDMQPTIDNNDDMITDPTSINQTNDIATQNRPKSVLQDTNITLDLNENKSTPIAPIITPSTSCADINKEKDIMTATQKTDPSIYNPAEKLKNIKEEKERISDQLEKLTLEIDKIIKNLENEFKGDKKTDEKYINKNNTKHIEETPIKKIEYTKKIEIETQKKESKDTKEEQKIKDEKETAKAKDNIELKNKEETKVKDCRNETDVTEKDLKELEEFLSKEKINEIQNK
ncbi:MAG: hypothetical protein K0B07_02880 [DPANN group archaeon]|nr:hypothetical protein [DPANN group archaeon]